jgi:cytochrome c-type biogenesis protein
VGLGVLILSHLDKQVETALVEASPEWLTALTTSF